MSQKGVKVDPIDEQLKKIGKAFIGNHVVGAPEATMRLMKELKSYLCQFKCVR